MFVWSPSHTFYVLFVQPAIRRDPATCCKPAFPQYSQAAGLLIAPQLNLIHNKRDLLWIT